MDLSNDRERGLLHAMRYSTGNKWRLALGLICTLAFILSSCQANLNQKPSPAVSAQGSSIASTPVAGAIPAPTPAETRTPTHLMENTSPVPTSAIPSLQCPRTILFFGDSRLGAVGISFVENIKQLIGPCYSLINASFWAHTAVWGSAHLQERVIARGPDVVGLWWGANDFNGCNGTTDQATNLPDRAKFNDRLSVYITAMRSQIETLSALGTPVYVFDEPRVAGGLLPYAVEDKYGNVSAYDYNHLCPWNWVSDAVAQAQKQLVMDESAHGQKVFLVDVWQLYMDDGTLPDMYSTDVVHPGSVGRQKIAELFIKAFQANSQP
jgi:lysophospholipase L1-like esterase